MVVPPPPPAPAAPGSPTREMPNVPDEALLGPAYAGANDPSGIPTGPLPPDTLTFSNLPTWITYLGSAGLFIVGLLTSAGVVLPSNTSGMIQAVTGAAVTGASLIVALASQLSHHSVQKAAINSPTTVVALPSMRMRGVVKRNMA